MFHRCRCSKQIEAVVAARSSLSMFKHFSSRKASSIFVWIYALRAVATIEHGLKSGAAASNSGSLHLLPNETSITKNSGGKESGTTPSSIRLFGKTISLAAHTHAEDDQHRNAFSTYPSRETTTGQTSATNQGSKLTQGTRSSTGSVMTVNAAPASSHMTSEDNGESQDRAENAIFANNPMQPSKLRGSLGGKKRAEQVREFLSSGIPNLSALSYIKVQRLNLARMKRSNSRLYTAAKARLEGMEAQLHSYLDTKGISIDQFVQDEQKKTRDALRARSRQWRKKLRIDDEDGFQEYRRKCKERKEVKERLHGCPASKCVKEPDLPLRKLQAEPKRSVQVRTAISRARRQKVAKEREEREAFLRGGPLLPSITRYLRFRKGRIDYGRANGQIVAGLEAGDYKMYKERVDAWLSDHGMTLEEFEGKSAASSSVHGNARHSVSSE